MLPFTYRVLFLSAFSVLCGCGVANLPDSPASVRPANIKKSYVVSDLIRSYESPKNLGARIDEWIVCLTANVDSGKWDGENMEATADYSNESIVVLAPSETHKRVGKLLEDMLLLNRQIAAGLAKLE